jgi:hypothetical protein
MNTPTYTDRINSLCDYGYENNLELWITERDNHIHFSIDNWNNGEIIVGSYPMEGATFALNMSFIRARMESIVEGSK